MCEVEVYGIFIVLSINKVGLMDNRVKELGQTYNFT